jgi:HK97 family phage prohead protease
MLALAVQHTPRLSPARGASEIKRAGAAVTRADEAGAFEGYASLFGVLDTGGDIVLPGAFARSLRKRGAAGVKMLWQHKTDEPIGVWTTIEEDARGLKVRGRLDLSVARAREALSLLRSGAVDGLSIGFRTLRAATDKSSGARRLTEIDLWEISLVTFPMLPQARVAAVKRAPVSIDHVIAQLARLKAHRAAERFEAKLLRLALEQRYAPDQPRVPAGSPEGGRWTSGGGSGAAGSPSSNDVALNNLPGAVSDAIDSIVTRIQERFFNVDLAEDEAQGGHPLSRHGLRSPEKLIERANRNRLRLGPVGRWEDRVGSFSSFAAANSFVNAALSKNAALVDEVISGKRSAAVIKVWFDRETGYESYRDGFRAPVVIRPTTGVLVVIRQAARLKKGFLVYTAYPINP